MLISRLSQIKGAYTQWDMTQGQVAVTNSCVVHTGETSICRMDKIATNSTLHALEMISTPGDVLLTVNNT